MNTIIKITLMVCFLAASTNLLAQQRYWVTGGDGKWSNPNNWAGSSGGPSGATVPISTYDVFFDENSSGTAILDMAGTVRSIDFTGSTINFNTNGVAQTLDVYGDFVLSPNATFKVVGTINFLSALSPKIDFAYWDISSSAGPTTLKFGGNGTYTFLSDAIFTLGNVDISVDYGTLNTNGFDVNVRNFSLNATQPTTLNLGSSHVTANNFSATNSPQATLNAGTSTLILNVLSGGSAQLLGGNKTYYNVQTLGFPNTSIAGDNSINNLEIKGYTIVTGTNTIANIIHNFGKTLVLPSGKIQTLTGNYLSLGTTSAKTGIIASNPPSVATITKSSGVVNFSNMTVDNFNVTGGATFNVNTNSCTITNGNTCTTGTGCLNISTANNKASINTLALANPGDRYLKDGAFNYSASSGTSLPITLTATGAATGTVTAGSPAILLINPASTGLVTLTATAGGDATYFPAAPIIQTFRVLKSKPTINTAVDQTAVYSSSMPQFNMGVASTSTGVKTYSIHNGTNGTINSATGLVTPTGAGVLYVKLSIAADANYLAASAIVGKVTITKLPVTITGAAVVPRVYDGLTSCQLDNNNLALLGILAADVNNVFLDNSSASATFSDKTAGNGKTVTFVGFKLNGTKAGNYTLTQPPAGTGNITPKNLLIFGVTLLNKAYNGNTTAILGGTPVLNGVLVPDQVFLNTAGATGTFASKNIGSAIPVSISGYAITGNDAGNYTLSQPSNGTASINGQAPLTFTGVSVANKTYDGNGSATLVNGASGVLSGLFSGDQVTLNSTSATASFSNAIGNGGPAGTYTSNQFLSGYTISGIDAGNYLLSMPSITVTIFQKPVTITAGAQNKVYNASTAATPINETVVGAIAGNTPNIVSGTATFSDKNVGTSKTVTFSGYSLSSPNYSLAGQPANTTADITVKGISVSGIINVQNKVYDGTTVATTTGGTLNGVSAGDQVTISAGTATFSDKNVGGSKTVTLAGYGLGGSDGSNYILLFQPMSNLATITPKSLTVNITGLTAQDKVYDGNVFATVAGNPVFTGAVPGDQVMPNGGSAEFANKNVGAAKPVTYYCNLAGNDAANYTVTNLTGLTASISPRPITTDGVSVQSKTYDGTAGASISSYGSLSGIVSGDLYGYNTGIAAFSNKNAGSGKTVTFSGFGISGTDAGNYVYSQPANATANITPRGLSVTGATAQNKVYDGNTSASVSGTLGGTVISGDAVGLSLSGNFADKLTGISKIVTGFGLTGADAGNYTLSQPSSVIANITAKPITVSGIFAQDKIYDGTLATTIGGTAVKSGVIAGDLVTLNIGSAAFANANVGTGKPVTFSGFTLTNTDANNYSLVLPAGPTASITAKAVTVTVTPGQGKTYGATDPIFAYTGTGLLGIDQFTGALSRAVGENVSSYAINQGTLAAGSNYTITFAGNNFAITKATPVVTFNDVSKKNTDADFALDAVFTPAGAITYTDQSSNGLITLNGSTVHLTGGTGSVNIQACIPSSANYNSLCKTVALTISDLQIPTITFNNVNTTYGSAAFDLSATSNSNGAITYSIVSGTGATVSTTGHVIITGGGPVVVQASQAATTTFANTSVNATITIATVPATVTATTGQSKVYGANDPILTYTSTGLIGTDAFTGSLSRAAGEAAGTYAINQGTLTAGSGYTITFVTKNFAVTAKPITVTATAGQSKVYGATDPTFAYTSTGLNGGDLFTGSLSRAAGANVGSYAISQGTLTAGSNYTITFVGNNFTVTAKPVTVTATAGQSKVYGATDPTFAYTSTGLNVGDLFTGSLSRAAGENVSSYAISQGTLTSGSNYTITFVGNNFAITAKPVTVSVTAGQSKVYGATDPTFAYTSTGLNVGDLFTGSLSRLAGENVGSSYAISQGTLTAGSNYSITFAGSNFAITKATPVVTFNDLFKRNTDADFALNAVFTPAGAITYTDQSSNGLITLNGSTVHLTGGTGSVNIQACIPSSANYNSLCKTAVLTISNLQIPTITFNNVNTTYGSAAFDLSATSNSNGAITYSVLSGTGATVSAAGHVTVTGTGQVQVQAVQSSSTTFGPGGTTATITILQGTPVISNFSDLTKLVNDANFDLAATTNSDGTISYQLLTGSSASLSGKTIHILGAGTVSLKANVPATANYLAITKNITLTINKLSQTISFASLPSMKVSDPDLTLTATANSGLPVSYTSSNQAVATVNGNTLKVVGVGTTSITAVQGGNAIYNAATDVVQSLVVNKSAQAITFGVIAAKTFGDAAFTISATSSSSLPVTFAIASGPATISDNTVTIVGAGDVAITASQAGNSIYNAASDLTQTFTVAKSSQSITFNPLPLKQFGTGTFDLAGTASSALTVSYSSSNTAVASVSNDNKVTIVGAGETTITASQTGNANYNAAVNVTQTLTISKADQTITFGAIATKLQGDQPFQLTATPSSALAAFFIIASGPATVSGNTISLTGAGTVVVKASQAGNANYNAAADVSQSFCVTPSKPVITLSSANPEIPVLTSSSTLGNQWYFNGTSLSNSTSTSVNGDQAGSYTVQVTIGGCTSTMSDAKAVVVTELEKESIEFTSYPNPAEKEITIQWPLSERVQQVQIIDMSGRVMISGGEEMVNKPISTENYGEGMFIINIKSARGISRAKFIKK
jgi:hypothetical protein